MNPLVVPWSVDKLTRWPWRSFDDAGRELIAVQCCGVATVALFTWVALRSLQTEKRLIGKLYRQWTATYWLANRSDFTSLALWACRSLWSNKLANEHRNQRDAYWLSLYTSFSLHAWSSIMSGNASRPDWPWGTLLPRKTMNVSAKSVGKHNKPLTGSPGSPWLAATRENNGIKNSVVMELIIASCSKLKRNLLFVQLACML